MKYWGYLLAKLGGAFAIFFGLMKLTGFIFRHLEVINPHNPFSYDLGYT